MVPDFPPLAAADRPAAAIASVAATSSGRASQWISCGQRRCLHFTFAASWFFLLPHRLPPFFHVPETLPTDRAASSIICRDVRVLFADGTKALDGLDLHVGPGEIVSLVGPSGCGKTTLLRAIAGLQPLSGGSVAVQPAAAGGDGRLAYVFQQPALLPWRSALENVMLPLELLPRSAAPAVANDAGRRAAAAAGLEAVELSRGDQDKHPAELSGGMRMRVSIARALVTDPSVMLLDEPFAALDDMLRSRLGELVLRLWRQRQRTMLLVTHNIGEAVLLSHRVAVLRSGRAAGEVRVDLPQPRTETLRRTPEFGRLYGAVVDLLREGSTP